MLHTTSILNYVKFVNKDNNYPKRLAVFNSEGIKKRFFMMKFCSVAVNNVAVSVDKHGFLDFFALVLAGFSQHLF